MSQLTIILPAALEAWVEARVAEGRYADAGDYFRDLIRRDQDSTDEDAAWVRQMIEEGRRSGIVDAEPEAVIEDIIARRRALRG